jgi:nicotinamidase-related amidase
MKALLVVDMQIGCLHGEPPVHDADGVVERIKALAGAFLTRDLVVYIQHTDAETIIRHHNYIWREFLLPGGRKIKLVTTAECIGSVQP